MTKEEKEAIVAECRASGMTAKEWCQLKGIEYRKYCTWATRVNRKARKNEQGRWAKIREPKTPKRPPGETELHFAAAT